MGGFPALMIKPPESPVSQLAGVEQLKAAQQESQMRSLQIQQEQQKINDAHALTTAMASWDGKNYTDIPELVTKAGGSGNARLSATGTILAMREKASTIAKDDSITNQNNVESTIKQNDQLRGRVLNIVGIGDEAARQSAWDSEVTKEEKAGTIQPGQYSHTYPGDAQAMNLANHFALGSQIVKEQEERQRIALDAWKPLNGELVNTITQEKIGAKLDTGHLNQALQTRWQVLHPGETLPDQFTLKDGTPTEFERIDKVLEATERATGTLEQQKQTNAIRAQTFELARDKSDMKSVMGVDPKTGNTVLVPKGQADQMGIHNAMEAPADTVNKALAARHWNTLANKQVLDNAKPEDMGIVQLVDKLDAEGKLGPLASRWNEFMSGKVGAGDPEVSALRAKMGLSTTLLMQAHVGSRGSAQMLEHFEDLANQKKLDGPTLKAALGAEVDYVKDRAMDPNPPTYNKAAASKTSTSTAVEVPANVSKALASASSGRHTLSDGSVWDKHPDGKIEKVVKAE